MTHHSAIRFTLFVLLLLPLLATGQRSKRLQPGKLYEAGELLFAPRFGFKNTVPTGWSGILPRESEVFLLMSQTMDAEIYVFGREKGDLASLKKDWEKGIAMDVNLSLQAKAPVIENGTLRSEVIAAGPSTDKGKRGYAVARCSDTGSCVICLSVVLAQNFDAMKKSVDAFIDAATFEAPSSTSPYDDFNWKEFLAGKTLTALVMDEKGSKEAQIDLCADGTFTSNVSKRGILKNQNPNYKGKLTGTWTAEGVGEKGKIKLEFKKKLPALEAELSIKEERIYANGERYFAGESEKCKK